MVLSGIQFSEDLLRLLVVYKMLDQKEEDSFVLDTCKILVIGQLTLSLLQGFKSIGKLGQQFSNNTLLLK
jgi:hypothetical protein